MLAFENIKPGSNAAARGVAADRLRKRDSATGFVTNSVS